MAILSIRRISLPRVRNWPMALGLLCDEHVGNPLVGKLETSFHVERTIEVDSLGPGSLDEDVWRYAVYAGLAVFTNDADFVDGTAVPDDGLHPGVIRYVGTDWTAIYRATCEIDRHCSMDQLRGNTLYVPGNWV